MRVQVLTLTHPRVDLKGLLRLGRLIQDWFYFEGAFAPRSTTGFEGRPCPMTLEGAWMRSTSDFPRMVLR